MRIEYSKLRKCIFADQQEYERFRQLVVNLVMATDVMDKDLGVLRKKRWEKAFATTPESIRGIALNESPKDIANRKATIVLEHLIQASDVSHTMQHWHVYIKWVSSVSLS